MNQPNQEIRQKVQKIARKSLEENNVTAWFDTIYQSADGDINQIPWTKFGPHFALQMWLKEKQVLVSDQNQKALVIGCGLGDDAEALSQVGFQVTAFDVSPTAIAWCQTRFPNSQVNYQVADLFAENEYWRKQFDFVFECHTIQALPLKVRSQVIEKTSQFVAEGGKLLLITRLRHSENEPDGPPWPLSIKELSNFEKHGLTLIEQQEFVQEATPEITTLRLEYLRIAR
jgi:2-polyprenyl-3-methyl-5-hydroxy-6-metoxy-1,4-benzoquinol methylase